MSLKTVSVTEAARHFSDLINRVAYRGEAFILQRGGRNLAELHPVPQGRCLGDLAAIVAAWPRLTDDEAAGFAKDLRAIRQAANRHKARDPWAS